MKIKFNKLHQFLATLVILIIPVASHFGQVPGDDNYFSSKNRLGFGNSLYRSQDYLRALEEFKSYLKSNTDDTVQFRFANCFYRIGRFTEAADNFKGLFYDPSIGDGARLMFYKSIFFQNDFKTFRELAGRENYLSQKYRKEIERLASITYFMDNIPLPKENVLLEPFPDSVQSKLSSFYLMKKFPTQKSVTTAVLLSTIIPGAGKIYTGEIGDGITSLVVTTLSAYLAISNFKNDHQFRGWLFTGLTAFFYGGNLYGSAASAQIYNARVQFDFDKNIKLFFEERNYFLPEIDF